MAIGRLSVDIAIFWAYFAIAMIDPLLHVVFASANVSQLIAFIIGVEGLVRLTRQF
jgi:hypothetical protein